MLKPFYLLCVIFVECIYCQFGPGFSSPFAPPWGRGSNSQRPGQRISNLINAQPLGLNEQQGQQLFNQIAGQVLQNMGSTAQMRTFNSPDGIDQRFNSFTPQQLMPPGASPIGFTDGSSQSLQPNGFGNNNFNWREDFNGRSPLTNQFSMGQQVDPRLQRSIFTERNRPQQNAGFDNIPLQRDLPFANNGFTSGGLQTPGMSSGFPEVIPVDPSSIPMAEDPIGRALQRNTRLKERLNSMNVMDDKVLVTGPETNALQEIRRENRRLRKLLRQKNRGQNYEQRKTILVPQPPPPPPPKPQKKNNNIGVGLILGAIGALAFG